MSKRTVTLNGKKVVLDMSRPKVADALAALIEACAERHFPIGMVLEHGTQVDYLLSRIKQYDGSHRAYLINTETGVARNSDKVVKVQEPKGGEFGRGYVTDLPCRKDRFIDPDNDGEFIDM